MNNTNPFADAGPPQDDDPHTRPGGGYNKTPVEIDFTTMPLGPYDNPHLSILEEGRDWMVEVCTKCGKHGIAPADLPGSIVHRITVHGPQGPVMVQQACLIDGHESLKHNPETIITSLLARLSQVGQPSDVAQAVLALIEVSVHGKMPPEKMVLILAMTLSSLGALTLHPQDFPEDELNQIVPEQLVETIVAQAIRAWGFDREA